MQNVGGSLYSDSAPNLYLFRDSKPDRQRHSHDSNQRKLYGVELRKTRRRRSQAMSASKKRRMWRPGKSGAPLNFASIWPALRPEFCGGRFDVAHRTVAGFVSARVVQVLPNGDLGIEGVKQVTINGEHQILRIRGIVRGRDITPGNVILSRRSRHGSCVRRQKASSPMQQTRISLQLLKWITPF